MVLIALMLMTGCAAAKPQPEVGQIDVLVTLSRSASGGVGPSFDHVPQRGQPVKAVDAAGDGHRAVTDADGYAHFTVPPGEYGVTADFCPNGPVRVAVVTDEVASVSVDCLAP